ncbi:MFS transporter [Rhodobacteraceae bacterium RKSG542]|uniref:MFS transporter n=1 Tax=Pseudovibrio flavus TaxID=2529854 RepID=UPI0012BBAF9C|nr:MFS transporter [Pseudovibrio flavus]MTI16743.1 MFS transporter [Pseudovibrio flavus]
MSDLRPALFQHHLVPLLAIMTANACAQLASSTLLTSIPLELAASGHSSVEAGIIATAYSLGFVAGCLRGLQFMWRVGYIRAFSAAAAIAALLITVMDLWQNFWIWALLRFFMGACLAMVFACADAWLGAAAPEQVRGRIFSANALFMGATSILAQGVVSLLIYSPTRLMEVVSALLMFSVVVLCMTHSIPPQTTDTRKIPLKEVWDNAPVALAGALVSGAVTTSLITILPYNFANAGFAPSMTAIMICALYVGRLIFQYPLGVLSDKMDRRWLIMVCTGVIAVLAVIQLTLDPFQYLDDDPQHHLKLLFILSGGLIVIGGFSFPLYTLCIAHGFEYQKASGMALSMRLLFAWAMGCAAGPAATTVLLPILGENAPIYLIAVLCTGMCAFTANRLMKKKPQAPEHQTPKMVYPFSGLGIMRKFRRRSLKPAQSPSGEQT